jgi:phage terminase Nu1 subunit (DNA packaging protein)
MPTRTSTAGWIVNREELAGILACAPTTVDRWIRAGCPIIERGKTSQGHRLNSAEVVKWLRGRDALAAPSDGQADSRRRYTAAAAELKEYQLAEKRKEMIRVEDVAAVLGDELANVRSRLLSIPGRLAQTVAAMADPAAAEAAIAAEINAALAELTQG